MKGRCLMLLTWEFGACVGLALSPVATDYVRQCPIKLGWWGLDPQTPGGQNGKGDCLIGGPLGTSE